MPWPGHTLALNLTVLAYLTQCLVEATLGKIDPQVYFSTLSPEIPSFNSSTAMGLDLASCPFSFHSAENVFKYFFSLEDLSDDEFQICCRKHTHLPSSFHNWHGKRPRMPIFRRPDGHSSWLVTYLMAAKFDGVVWKFTTPTFWLANWVISKGVTCRSFHFALS
ncbi:hypothetical protein TB1_026797 [Malus domestica]